MNDAPPKEYPILFSGPMVQAILAGRKTQTRRIVKPQPSELFMPEIDFYHPTLIDPRDGEAFPGPLTFGASDYDEDYPFPYGLPGSRLWVRESMKFDPDGGWRYMADGAEVEADYCKSTPYCPSIHMPRLACRIILEITDVWMERLHDMLPSDAMAEGVDLPSSVTGMRAVEAFRDLWDSINAKRGFGWSVNPWVWGIEFKRVSP